MPSAEHRPCDQPKKDGDGSSHVDVVKPRTFVLAARIEAHCLSMARVDQMRTSLSFLVVLTAFFSAACAREVPAAPADNPQLVLGQQIWSSNCASCHGSAGEGRRGTKLNDGAVIARFPDFEAEVQVVADGRGGMPGYAQKLTAEEIDAVVAYTREVL